MIDDKKILSILKSALASMGNEVPFLNLPKAGERCIAARIAFYLQPHFCTHFVDVEYTGDLSSEGGRKKVEKYFELEEKAQACGRKTSDNPYRFIIPDIIIHKRSPSRAENLIVIEVKFKESKDVQKEFDREKLSAIKATYGYKHSVLLLIDINDITESEIELDTKIL